MDIRYYPEVKLKSDFLVVVETVSRMGILSNENTLHQTCHIFHDKGKYYIVHFMELFSMMDFKCNGEVDEKKIHMSEEDFERRNTIIYLLSNWNLIEPIDFEYILKNKGKQKIFVVPHKDKCKYEFKSKFQL